MENYQLVGDSAGPGRLENVVMLLPGVTVRACAACEPATATRTAVVIDDIRIEVGPFRFEFSCILSLQTSVTRLSQMS